MHACGGPSVTRGGPILAETDGLGGLLVAGDHLFCDTLTLHSLC